MRFLFKLFLLLSLFASTQVMADYTYKRTEASQQPTRTLDGYDIAIDLVLRPVGFVGTVAGTALYVGLSPLTLISQLYPPHDSFEKLGKLLVVQPAKYTFTRPVGDYAHESSY